MLAQPERGLLVTSERSYPQTIGPALEDASEDFVDVAVTPLRMTVEGDSVTGVYAGTREDAMEDGAPIKQHIVAVVDANGETNYGLLGGFVLDSFFAQIDPGTPVSVQYIGTVPATKPNRSPMKNYRTFLPKSLAQKLGYAALPAKK